MPMIGVLLNPGNTGANVRELHSQLLTLGAVIAPAEQTATNYGTSTVAAVRAFRQQYGLPASDAVDLPTGRLMHVASAFAGTGGRVTVRTAVREAACAAHRYRRHPHHHECTRNRRRLGTRCPFSRGQSGDRPCN